MRDIERIDRICGLLADAWKKYPDLRLGQFLEAADIFPTAIIEHRGVMIPFFQEDDKTEDKLRSLL